MLNFIKYFIYVNQDIEIFRFRVAVGIILQKLRKRIVINGKSISQNHLNDQIHLKYSKSWNSAREETLPNTRLENLYLISDYFQISLEEFFKQVNKISKKEIDEEIERKEKLQKHLKKLK